MANLERAYYQLIKLQDAIDPEDPTRADVLALISSMLPFLEAQLTTLTTKPDGFKVKLRVVAVAQNTLTLSLKGQTRDVYTLTIPTELQTAFAVGDVLTVTVEKRNA